MLISTLDGYINSADIVRVTQGRDYAVIRTRDGETWRAYAEADNIAMLSAAVIPALPGYTVLTAHGDEAGGLFVTRSPVVAWRIDEHMAVPVTPDDECGQIAILCPDGHVIVQHETTFKTEEAWLEERKREVAKKAAA